MQYTQHPHQIGSLVVNKDVILVRDQLSRTGNPAKSAQAGMIEQTAGFLCKHLIQRHCGDRVVGLDIGIDLVAILCRFGRPKQFQYLAAASSRRRVAARLAANLASTSAAGISLPALAESKPI